MKNDVVLKFEKLSTDYRKDHLNKNQHFFQNLLLVSSSVLGIIVALPTSISTSHNIRILYILALILLSTSCLLNAIQLYVISNHSLKMAVEMEKRLAQAHKGFVDDSPVWMPVPKWILSFQKIALFCFPIALIFLAIYSVIIV